LSSLRGDKDEFTEVKVDYRGNKQVAVGGNFDLTS